MASGINDIAIRIDIREDLSLAGGLLCLLLHTPTYDPSFLVEP